MKIIPFVLLCFLWLPAAPASEPALSSPGNPVPHVKAAAVTELRGKDHAFALMIETYRQIQELMIEGDYNKHLELAQRVANPTERARLTRLALDERNARLTKLEQTLQDLQTAYASSRKDDERKTGQTIAATASADNVAPQLKSFVPFQPKGFRVENGPSELVPAGAQMLYGSPSR